MVVVSDLDGAGAEAVAAGIIESGGQAAAASCDQTDDGAVTRLFAEVIEPLGRLDILFANAGWASMAPLLTMSVADWRRTFEVNVTGTFLMCRAAARRMVECGNGGAITVTSSAGASHPSASFAAYCSAKAALESLVAAGALELGIYDIRMNAVSPGVTATSMTRSLLDGGGEQLIGSRTPLGRVATPADVAAAVSFLSSDNASYITGSTLPLDGGGGRWQGWLETDFAQRGQPNWKLRNGS